ncbi:MAG: segregation/condensation protein A [Candidatus Marinimicrobia bacterium]|nr:segregation/condensation protein A [Candidatus Neomarinimicrobiota bacterium]
MSYNIKLDIFEGPLDLLLFFIQRDEINIYDIPISEITQEYLEYVEILHQLKLSIAGEFLEMAALLMRIKVKMLLPNTQPEDEEIEDPRTELVDLLLEYKKYKLAALTLKEKETAQTGFLEPRIIRQQLEKNNEADLSELSIYDIGLIFRKIVNSMPEKNKYEIKKIRITITEQIEFVRNYLENHVRFSFQNLTEALTDRIEIIATFLAVLEMIKNGIIQVIQEHQNQEIWIQKA